jgi:outer membrane receptor protein involved in Fe transport
MKPSSILCSRVLAWMLVGIAVCLATAPVVRAQAASTPPTSKDIAPEDVVQMNPFNVSTSQDYGYRKLGTVTSSRTGELVSQMPQAIEIISSELLNDFLANNGNAAFRYSSSVQVSENEVGQADVMNLRGFALPRYYNGVSLANSSSLVPVNIWDNIDRIEVVKGPVGLYYPASTPNGVANFITKKPEFTNAASLTTTFGTYEFRKVVVDDQHTLLNNKVGIRVVASAGTSGEGYHLGSPTRYTFVSPSITIRPFKSLEITAEMDYLREQNGYQGGANAWNYSYNPDWQKYLTNPTAQMIAYFQSKYSLPDTAATLAFIQSRWSPPNSAVGPALTTWSSDMLAITGTAPFLYTTQKINWNIFSPYGDKWAGQSNQSTYGGYTPTYEVSVTETPLEGLSLRYHWVQQTTNQQFVRQIIAPSTNGFRLDGRVNALDAASVAIQGINNDGRWASSDTQQLDLHFEKEFWGVKHEFGAGVEYLRTKSAIWVYPVNFALAGTATLSNGTFTGVDIYHNYDPFGTSPVSDVYKLIGGAPTLSAGKVNLNINHQDYVSYRASFMDDRVHALVGVNRYVVDPSGRLNTPLGNRNNSATYGIIAEVTKGISVFASKSSSVQFTNLMSVTGVGVLPSDNAHPLDNEKGNGFEMGLKSTWHNNELTGTCSYYDDTRDGVVSGDILRNLSDPRNAVVSTVQFNVNGGHYVSRGVDLDLSWTPNDRFQMLLNYNHTIEAIITSDPSVNPNTTGTLTYQREFLYPLSHTPKDRANLVGKYNFAGGHFSVGGSMRYSATYLISNANTSLLWVPQQTMLDAFVAYRTKLGSVPTELRLNATNITNVRDDYSWGNGREYAASVVFHF